MKGQLVQSMAQDYYEAGLEDIKANGKEAAIQFAKHVIQPVLLMAFGVSVMSLSKALVLGKAAAQVGFGLAVLGAVESLKLVQHGWELTKIGYNLAMDKFEGIELPNWKAAFSDEEAASELTEEFVEALDASPTYAAIKFGDEEKGLILEIGPQEDLNEKIAQAAGDQNDYSYAMFGNRESAEIHLGIDAYQEEILQ